MGDITVSGGTVTATVGEYGGGAGIGTGGNTGSLTMGDITISGGTVTATVGVGGSGAGIGTGGNEGSLTMGDIIISGGTVSATVGEGGYGAGIGIGYNLGTVTCVGITISDKVSSLVVTKGDYAVHSIGIGYNDGGTFSYGTIIIGGETKEYIEDSPFIFPKQTYTVAFDGNGGSGSMEKQTLVLGDVLQINTFIREGYVFAGWNTAKDGSGMSFNDGAKVLEFQGTNTNVTLYAQWCSNVVDLAGLTDDFIAKQGDILTGTLASDSKISIADGATVTLNGVTINGENNNLYKWAGLTCEGNCTIVLAEGSTNTLKGFYEYYPGIYVPEGSTLTIEGSGSLEASSNGWGAGIGGGYKISCGNIVIKGGTVTATGGRIASGIGSGYRASHSNITITNGVTKVTAIKGDDAPYSIGKGYSDIVGIGTITIGGNVVKGGIKESPYVFAPYVNIASVSGGSMTCDNYLAVNGETVTLTAAPNDGYVLEGVEVKDAEGNVVAVTDGKWFSNNKASFTMPANGVTVVPKFTKDFTNLYVNIPKSGTVKVNVPENVASFKVYDDGGEDGDYSNDAIGRLWIVPLSAAYTVRLTGKATLLSRDEINIDNAGSITNNGETGWIRYGTLFNSKGSDIAQEMSIGELTATTSALVELTTDASGNASGLDLTVSMEMIDFSGVGVLYVEGLSDGWKEFFEGLYGMVIPEKIKSIGLVGGKENAGSVNIPKNIDVDTAIIFRKFPEKTYSTVVLPFDVNTDNLEGLDAVLSYNGIGKDKDGNDAIRMKVVWATEKWVEDNQIKDASGQLMKYTAADLTANTPYLIQMGQERLVVKGKVTFKETKKADVSKDGWTFRGTWVYKIWDDDNDPELGYAYGFAASEATGINVGDFVRVGKGAWINPMRAYLIRDDKASPLQGIRANGNYVMRPSVVRKELPELMSIVIDNDGDASGEQTTVIGHFNARTGEFRMNNAGARTYDLKGRYVGDKANKARGAYYGKKVLK